jgi:excisionase family DNA binding protein
MPRRRKRMLTIAEVADYLQVHPSTVYRLLKAKHIPAMKVGSNWRVHPDELETWCNEQSTYVRRKT